MLNAKLVKKTYLTKDIVLLDFECPSFEFESGQFITVKIPFNDAQIDRSYSLASSSNCAGIFSLCVKIVPEGIGSNFLANLQLSEQISFDGPLGSFVLSKSTSSKDLLFVATGVGLAPFLSMLTDFFTEKEQRQVYLYFGVRYEEDLFYVDFLEELASKNQNFHLFITISQPSETWTGLKGRVTEHLFRIDNSAEAYICGNGDMVKDVYLLLRKLGFDTKTLHVEQFSPIDGAAGRN